MVPAVIAGLGNPGTVYAQTRHNTGFHVLDALASRARATFRVDSLANGLAAKATLGGRVAWLVKPLTYMNDSGTCVSAHLQFYKLPVEGLLVVHDDINLALGAVKLSVGGGDGGHNGLTSILQHLPNTFARLRIGIGGKHWPGQDLADHVLGKFTDEEQTILANHTAFYVQGIETWLAKGTSITQNFINRKPTQ
ncbi:MAG: aminoacyl-tRNA hydrolase [Puniceicoccales bacterium]|jgi:PTH1 family peptidyl-tRNA hydrolase|nr:aminoacyl-tRNA hydrolase [Puniceicoccales bacterium]